MSVLVPETVSDTSDPRLWVTFTLAWLTVLVITATLFVTEPITPLRRFATLADLVLLALLYLRLTLRGAPRVTYSESGMQTTPVTGWQLIGLLVLALLVIPAMRLLPDAGMWWHVIYAIVAAGLLLRPPIAGIAIVTLVTYAMTSAWLVSGRLDMRLLIQLAIGGTALVVRHLTITVEELRLTREALAARAVDEERLRIARDLHDLLGHSLSLVAIKSELAGRLLPRAPNDAAREILDIERAARHALRQVREAVAGYRQPTLRSELSAARELLAASAIAVTVDDRVGVLPVAVDGLFAWSVREGVTNVIRHSRADNCVIRMSRSSESARLSIANRSAEARGPVAERANAPSAEGYGLAGLRERATALGGLVTTSALGGGFALEVEVPLPGNGRSDE